MGFLLIELVLTALLVAAFVVRPSKDFDDGRPGPLKVIGARIGIAVVLALVFIFNAVIFVPSGSVYVATLFGTVQKETYGQGIHFVNPMLSMHEMTIRRQIAEFQSGSKEAGSGDVVAVASDSVPLTIDVTYAWATNPTYASWLFQKIGDESAIRESLVKQAARSATRTAAAAFTYGEATTTKRDNLVEQMGKDFKASLVANMVGMGLSPDEADKVFNVLPVQLRAALPPEKVLNAISEKAASEQDLQRQKVLTDIAQQEALRREQEGVGVAKLFAGLPKGFSATEIAQVLGALANKEKADAMLKAVENGKVTTMIMDGAASPAVNVDK